MSAFTTWCLSWILHSCTSLTAISRPTSLLYNQRASSRIPKPSAYRQGHGGLDAARSIASLDFLILFLQPHNASEHNVFARWQITAAVEALLGHCAIPVHVRKGQGAGNRRRSSTRFVPLGTMFNCSGKNSYWNSSKNPTRTQSEDILAIQEKLRPGKGCQVS